jgi:hypothetical protein
MKGGRNNLALENGKSRGSVPSNQGNVNVGLVQRNKAKTGGKRVDKTNKGSYGVTKNRAKGM